jgi:hypothetical protein
MNGHLEIVKLLVEYGYNDYNNAFFYSCENNHLEIVKYLVECGADIDVRNNYALRISYWKDYLEIVKFLEKCGALL